MTQLFSLRFLAQQKKERLAREAKEAKDAVASEKRQKQEVWRRNQEKKKAVKPGEDPDELEGVGDDGPSAEQIAARDLRAAAMGGGDDELFEKKLTTEDKKASGE